MDVGRVKCTGPRQESASVMRGARVACLDGCRPLGDRGVEGVEGVDSQPIAARQRALRSDALCLRARSGAALCCIQRGWGRQRVIAPVKMIACHDPAWSADEHWQGELNRDVLSLASAIPRRVVPGLGVVGVRRAIAIISRRAIRSATDRSDDNVPEIGGSQ